MLIPLSLRRLDAVALIQGAELERVPMDQAQVVADHLVLPSQ
jgi:hypothetical protein